LIIYEYNPAREQEDALKREEMEIEMAIIAKGMDAEKDAQARSLPWSSSCIDMILGCQKQIDE
jgi:hypothetical protein